MKLISMTEFVLQSARQPFVDGSKYKEVVSYATFLKQPLKLEMFVPCDDSGNVLEEPMYDPANAQYYESHLHAYHSAKEKVLFDGFEVIRGEEPSEFTLFLIINGESISYRKDWECNWNFDYTNIESLCFAELGITLTPNAIKQIGL